MTMIERIRSRRAASRQARAIDSAVRSATTPAMRDEILTIAQRYHG